MNEDEFQPVWAARVDREGGNPKPSAFLKFKARIKEGHTVAEILQGLCRYKFRCEAKGLVGTPYVMQLRTFLGPDKHFLEPWTVKAKFQRAQSTRGLSTKRQLEDRSWAYGEDS